MHHSSLDPLQSPPPSHHDTSLVISLSTLFTPTISSLYHSCLRLLILKNMTECHPCLGSFCGDDRSISLSFRTPKPPRALVIILQSLVFDSDILAITHPASYCACGTVCSPLLYSHLLRIMTAHNKNRIKYKITRNKDCMDSKS